MAPHAESEVSDGSHNVYELIEEIFEASTQEADSTDLIKKLDDLYESFGTQGFKQSFKHILQIVLSESKRSVEVRRILCFISESAVTLDNKYKNENAKESTEDIDDIIHPLLKYLFKVLARWSQASCYIIRFRSCQLLHMILTYIQDHGVGEIDMTTYESIAKIIETRRLDISCNVRAHAVLLAKFFQDPSSVNDPVIAGLCWQLQDDPNPRVRQNIVSIIAACEETIIPITKRFLFDKNANVRNAALLHICNRISPRSFTSKQRIAILNQCFSDSSALVRRNAEERLIPVWFRAYKDKLCRFFKDLRIGNGSLDNLVFINKLLKVLSKCVKIAHIIAEIDLDLESRLPKPTLNADIVFLWRRFYTLAQKEERLSRFVPEPEDLIEFISKCLKSSSFGDEESMIFNELSLFLMDIINVAGVEKCENIFPVVLNMMKNPYVSHEVMPYIVALYLRYFPLEKELVHAEIFQVIEDLQKMIQFTPPEEEKNILIKCFSIASQLLIEENSVTNSIRKIKDNLIINYLSSEDPTLKKKAIITLSLYCQIDRKEAKSSWPLFAEAVYLGSSNLKRILLKGAFDILKCYGDDIFSNIAKSAQEQLDEAVDNLLSNLEDDALERSIIVQGTLKLYLAHYTWSPCILSKIILLYFHPEEYHSTNKDIDDFLQLYGETKEEAECLCKAFGAVVNLLFESNKNSPYHKVSLKTVALQLTEFSERFENSKTFSLEEKFQDLLVLKLTKQFLKKPWRLPAPDLYTICHSIIPKNLEKLLKLKEHVKLIIESLHSAVFQQKNPYSKKSAKQFSSYIKRIQSAIDTAPFIRVVSKNISPLEKRLFTDSSVNEENSLESSKQMDINVDDSPSKDEPSLERSLSSETSPSLENSSLSRNTSALTKTPAPAAKAKTPVPTTTHAPAAKTPVPARMPAPAKTPAPAKIPAPKETSSQAAEAWTTTKAPSTRKTTTAKTPSTRKTTTAKNPSTRKTTT